MIEHEDLLGWLCHNCDMFIHETQSDVTIEFCPSCGSIMSEYIEYWEEEEEDTP